MAIRIKHEHLLEMLPQQIFEEVIGFLTFKDIINLAASSAILRKRLEDVCSLEERRIIVQTANMIKFGSLLFSEEELRKIGACLADNDEGTRCYKTSVVAFKIISEKKKSLSFFFHQSTEQLNTLALECVKNRDLELLSLLIESHRILELSEISFHALIEHLSLLRSPLLVSLIQSPRFQILLPQRVYSILIDYGISQNNFFLVSLIIQSPHFNTIGVENYVSLLNLAALGCMENFRCLALHSMFELLEDNLKSQILEIALSSNQQETLDFILRSHLKDLINVCSLSRAFQLSCFTNQHISVAALINYPGILSISDFSIEHSFESLYRNKSCNLSLFIHSPLFNRLSSEAILEGLKFSITNEYFAGWQAILSSLYVGQLIEQRAFYPEAIATIHEWMQERRRNLSIQRSKLFSHHRSL